MHHSSLTLSLSIKVRGKETPSYIKVFRNRFGFSNMPFLLAATKAASTNSPIHPSPQVPPSSTSGKPSTEHLGRNAHSSGSREGTTIVCSSEVSAQPQEQSWPHTPQRICPQPTQLLLVQSWSANSPGCPSSPFPLLYSLWLFLALGYNGLPECKPVCLPLEKPDLLLFFK